MFENGRRKAQEQKKEYIDGRRKEMLAVECPPPRFPSRIISLEEATEAYNLIKHISNTSQ
jgi:hypothetical protein